MCARVLPAWPEKGQACLFPVTDFVGEELRDDLLDPTRCLLPRAQWPESTPRSKVHATDAEWYSLVKAGAKLGIFGQVTEGKLFRGLDGKPVVNGAMGVDKPKFVDGRWVTLLQFIRAFCPINAFLRRLRGDSRQLPFLNTLSLVLLEDGEGLLVDTEDMQW